MTKEKIIKSYKYQQLLKDLLAAPVSAKHIKRNSEKQLKEMLQKELAAVTRKIDEAKLDGVK